MACRICYRHGVVYIESHAQLLLSKRLDFFLHFYYPRNPHKTKEEYTTIFSSSITDHCSDGVSHSGHMGHNTEITLRNYVAF